jgi:hypothetical protein
MSSSTADVRLIFNTRKDPAAWELNPYSENLQNCFHFLVFQESYCPWLTNGEHPPEDLRIRQLVAGVFIREQLGAKGFHYEPVTPVRFPRGTAPTAKAGGHLWVEFYKLAAILFVSGHTPDHPLVQMKKLLQARSGILLPWCLPSGDDMNPWSQITRENTYMRGREHSNDRLVVNPYQDCPPSWDWVEMVLALGLFNECGKPVGTVGKMFSDVLKARAEYVKTWKSPSQKKRGKGYRTTPTKYGL